MINKKILHKKNIATHPASAPLAIDDVTVAYNRKPVLWDIDIDIPEGKLIGIVGPNGAGKSTLIKACLNLIPLTSGRVMVYGKPYKNQRHLIGYVPQRESVDWDFPVSALDVVVMGAFGRIGWFKPILKKHREEAYEALEKVGIAHLAQRQIGQLSGGQQQRVFLARALVQKASIYLMDEPFAAVDAATEKAIVVLLQELRSQNKTCLVVHHDLATVNQYFDWTILINMRIVAKGPTEEVFTHKNLQDTYGGKLNLIVEAGTALSQEGR